IHGNDRITTLLRGGLMRLLVTNRFALAIALGLIGLVALVLQFHTGTANAQAENGKRRANVPGITRQAPSAAAASALLDPNDTVILLIDHQTGLLQTVKDVAPRDMRMNAVILAKIAEKARAPIIWTASVPDGPNGPIMQELSGA